MPITYQYLTDRTLVTTSAITTDTLIHVVNTNDLSQNPAGSSYKAKLSQILPALSGLTFTGGSSNCISDLYVSNIHSCSPLLINKLNEGNVYFGSTSGITLDVINKRIGINTNNPQHSLHISGNTLFNGTLSATTISATTYLNLPTTTNGYLPLSGGTVSGATNFTNGLSANTLSATTYLNLPTIVNGYLPLSGGTVTGGTVFTSGLTANTLNISGSSSSDLVRITQTGIGNSFVVEDSTNPDSTPFVIDTSGNTGIGTTTPTAKLHIKGIDSSSSNISFKVEDSSNRNILSARNDNFVYVGDNSVSSYLWLYGLGGQFGFSNENGFPYLFLSSSYSGGKFYFSNGSSGSGAFAQINTSNGNWLIGSPNTTIFGSNLTDTKLTLQGVDSTSSNFGLKVQKSGGTDIFVVRNDGNVGIGTSSPTEKLHIDNGNILVQNTNGSYRSDIQNATGPLVLLSGNTTGVSRFGVVVPTYDSISLGVRGPSAGLPGYGNIGDGFIYSSNANNGINIISAPGVGTNDYIRFYAGQTANGTTPDIHIQGSGSTRGYVGIGTESPTEKLQVNGNTLINGTLSATTISATTYQNLPTKEVFYKSHTANEPVFELGGFFEPAYNGGTGPVYISGIIPYDFGSNISSEIILIPTASETHTINLNFSSGPVGGSFSATTANINFSKTYTQNIVDTVNVDNFFSGITANQVFSLNVFDNGNYKLVIGIKFKYKPV